MPPDTAVAYIEKNGFGRLVADAAVLQRPSLARQLRGRCEVIDISSDVSCMGALPGWWPHEPEDSSLVMVSHTSRTTGIPKAVRFEHRQFFMGKRARIGQFVEAPDERLLSALPQSHSSAISHLETAVLLGVPTYVHSISVGESVRAAIAAFRPTTVAAFPQTYVSLVEAGVAENEFPSVRRWFSMGDAAHQSHVRRILPGAPGSRFIDAFGSSELGMALFLKVSTSDNVAPLRAVGRPVDIAVAKVLDFTGDQEVSHGQVGLLGVRAPTLTPGYWRQSEQTAKAWRGGYFLTGDVGFCKDGDFYLVDRAADMISLPGGRLYTLLLEEKVQQIPGVCDASVLGVDDGDRTCLFALILPDRAHLEETSSLGNQAWSVLHEAARAAEPGLPPDCVTVAVAASLSAFPLGATGKVLKRRLRDDYAAVAAALAEGRPIRAGLAYLTNGLATLRCDTGNGGSGSDGRLHRKPVSARATQQANLS